MAMEAAFRCEWWLATSPDSSRAHSPCPGSSSNRMHHEQMGLIYSRLPSRQSSVSRVGGFASFVPTVSRHVRISKLMRPRGAITPVAPAARLTTVLESEHRDLKSLAFFAHHVFLRHPHILQRKVTRVAGSIPSFRE